MNSISLDAVAAITGIGRSTLWRRVADGQLAKGEKDARGRATLLLGDALGLIREGAPIDWSKEDVDMLLQADAGDAAAQADIGALLYLGGGVAACGARRLCTGCTRRPSKATPTPCSGWAPRMPPSAAKKTTTWR